MDITWLAHSSHALMLIAFVVGYLFIIFEHSTGINKATSALFMAVVCWAIQFLGKDVHEWNLQHLSAHLSDVSQVILFLIGALTIVEIIHAHGGLGILTKLFS